MSICVYSNAVLLMLICSLMVNIQYNLLLDPKAFMTYLKEDDYPASLNYPLLVLGAVVLLIYPLAGFLGDVKCGRLKLIKWSLSFLVTGITSEIVLFFIGYYLHPGNSIVVFVVILVIPVLAGTIGFQANIIQFGLDQLQELPSQDSSLFIHWYWCLYYVSMLIAELTFALFMHESAKYKQPYKFGFSISVIVLSSILLFLICFLFVVRTLYNFVPESRRINPYRLVYKVTRFAFRHKVPVRRSAFTYCEDEPPSRLDLGKGKFGGPFTTEQVENVKVFYEILKVLLSLGPVFFLEIPSSYMLQGFAQDWLVPSKGLILLLLKFSSLPLLAASFLLFYLCILCHFIAHLIPSMLKRMGMGFFAELLSLVAILIAYSIREFRTLRNCEVTCSINININMNSTLCVPFPEHMMLYSHIAPLVLSALSQLLIYIAMYEFICAQSPHYMKGLLIGLSFAIQGFFKSAGIVLITPFTYWHSTALSCEFGYYLTNVVIACVSFGAFVWVAKRYKYRVRDEPSRVRQFAEEYYSKQP